MDYVEGIAVSHTDQLIEAGYDLKEIGTKLVDNYATQVLDDGFFHADPHPATSSSPVARSCLSIWA